MTIRVGMNGFGRIGRTFVRRVLERDDIEVVAVNDITDARTLAHLLEFDSTYGRLAAAVTHSDDSIIIDGTPIRVLSSRDPAEIDWGWLGVAVVVESTGKFRARDQAALHLKGGAQKVLLSAPGKGADLTAVVGVNDGEYDPQRHDVISNASCATNCVAPMAQVLSDALGHRGAGWLPYSTGPSGVADPRTRGSSIMPGEGLDRWIGRVPRLGWLGCDSTSGRQTAKDASSR